MVPEQPQWGSQMNITIRLTKVEYEMLKELQKKDKRYKNGLEEKVENDILLSFKKWFT